MKTIAQFPGQPLAPIVALISLLCLPACQPQVKKSTVKPPQPVMVQSAEFQPSYTVEHRFVGQLYSSSTSAISFELGGIVQSIEVDTGAVVRQGDVLATLDTALLANEAEQLKANLAQVAAQRQLVDTTLDRQQALQDQGYQSQQQLDELNSQQMELDAQRQRLQASLAAITIRQEKSLLRAPFDGVLSQRQLAPGQVVNPGVAVMTLVPNQQAEARIGVPVTLLPRLAPKQQYHVRIQDQLYPAQFIGRSAEIDPTTRTLELRFALPTLQQAVFGDLAYLVLEEQVAQSSVKVPIESLLSGMRGRWNLMVAVDSGESFQLERRDITILHADNEFAYVQGAIQPDDALVIAGLQSLAAGQEVAPRNLGED